MPASLTITLYTPGTDDVEDEFSIVHIPFGIFTEFIGLMQTMDLEHPEQLTQEAVEHIYALIVALFSDRFTVDDLRRKTDFLEVWSLLLNIQTIVSKEAPGASVNPTNPGKTRIKRHR